MEKTLSQASKKISKNYEKKNLNSLIKLLRPKVYITNSSSFKTLVQELTGNGGSLPSSLPPPTVLTSRPLDCIPTTETIPTTDNVFEESNSSASSVEFSIGSSELSIPTSNHASDPITLNHSSTAFDESLRDLESWLLESTDQFSLVHAYEAHQEANGYDYGAYGSLYDSTL